MTINFLDLFSGIGGFRLGAEWAGLKFDKEYHSDIDDYANKVYAKHFPDSIQLGDITEVDFEKLKDGNEWLVCGGFPCQPHSLAGKRKASKDERDLWPECFRAHRILRPELAVYENVPGLFSSDRGEFFNGILSDISSIGYDCEWTVISAFDAGAPHLRERIWIVAYPHNKGLQKLKSPGKKQQSGIGFDRFSVCKDWGTSNPAEAFIRRGVHGIPRRVDRLKCLGNSIVPQIAKQIFRTIARQDAEQKNSNFF